MAVLLTDLLTRAAVSQPHHPATVCEGEAVTYAALHNRSNALANVLISQGVQRQDRVGIYMEKSLETATSIFGILKSGACYVPLDPTAPLERIEFVIRDCGIRHLISSSSRLKTLRKLASRNLQFACVVGIDRGQLVGIHCLPWIDVEATSDSAPGVKILEQDLAYVIYTSGSTGTPKGIMHTHHSGLSFARWAANEYGLSIADRVGNHSPLHFDISIFDFFATAYAGATTVILGERYQKMPASYTELLQRERVTVLFTVPHLLIQLLLRGAIGERDLSALRWIIFGGEPFPAKHLRALMAALPQATYDNMYGPAEVNGCTHYTIPGPEFVDLPIGRVAHICEALIVDNMDRPAPDGASGELLIRTPTMMQGYWAREDLNMKAFYNKASPAGIDNVYYRTGDLVREDAQGNLYFLGRRDRQVKIRGYRVELDEIESVLSSLPEVEEVAAFVVPGEDDSQALACAVTLLPGASLTHRDLIAQAKAQLPAYAVPGRLDIQHSFPRTTTGKIDRRQLAEAMAFNRVQEE